MYLLFIPAVALAYLFWYECLRDRPGVMSYYDYLETVWQDKQFGWSILPACQIMGILKPKYSPAEKLAGHIKWRVTLCVRYVQRILNG